MNNINYLPPPTRATNTRRTPTPATMDSPVDLTDLVAAPQESAVVASFLEFMSTRGKGKGCMLSTADIHRLTGKPRLDLHDHDIYVMGKTKQNETLWTKLRIESNTTAENKINGKMGVRFLEGYGLEKHGSSELAILFSEGIRQKTTQDSVGFKQRSAFYLGGSFYRLLHVEHLCNVNVMPANLQAKFQSSTSIKKAQMYSMQRARKREWAHISRERSRKDQRKKILRMMIPYWMNCPDFYESFLKDVSSACEMARVALGPVDPSDVVPAVNVKETVDLYERTKRARSGQHSTGATLSGPGGAGQVAAMSKSTGGRTDRVVW